MHKACFFVSISDSKTTKSGTVIGVLLKITQHNRDSELMDVKVFNLWKSVFKT